MDYTNLKLSKPQSECIEAARENRGRLYRYGTGMWSKSKSESELDNNGFPVWYFQHNTVKSLIDRGIFEAGNFIEAPGFRNETFMTVYLKE